MQTSVEMTYGGFWRRLVANFVDQIFFSLVMLLMVWLLLVIFGEELGFEPQLALGVELLLSFIPLVLTLFFWMKFAATPGKMALSLKVVDARTGQNPSFG